MQTIIDWTRLNQRTTFIVGFDKGVGKTTLMALASARLRAHGLRPALLTTGLSGNTHGGIPAEPGDWLVTSDTALQNSDSYFAIHHVFAERTVMGRLALVEALRPGTVELVGPRQNRYLTEILNDLQARKQADFVLVDGAVNRITQISTSRQPAYIPVFSLGPENLQQGLSRMRLCALLSHLTQINPSVMPVFEFDGALTASKLKSIPESTRTVVIQDIGRIFLTAEQWESFSARYHIFLRQIHELLFMVVNLRDIKPEDFLRMIDPSISPQHIMFNPYQECAVC